MDEPRPLRKFQLRTWEELQAVQVPEREAMFVFTPEAAYANPDQSNEWVMKEKDLGLIWAKRGHGKSTIAIGMAVAAASGTDFAGLKATRPFRVTYIDAEMSLDDFRSKVKGCERRLQPEAIDALNRNLQCFSWEDNIRVGGMELVTERGRLEFDLMLSDRKKETGFEPELVIVDNIMSLTGGVDVSSSEEWAPVGEWSSRKRADMAWWWIHHATKSGDKQLGTSAREIPVSFIIKLDQTSKKKRSMSITIHTEKMRGRSEPDDWSVVVEFDDGEIGCRVETREGSIIGRDDEKIRRLIPFARVAIKDLDLKSSTQMATDIVSRYKEDNHGVGIRKQLAFKALRIVEREMEQERFAARAAEEVTR